MREPPFTTAAAAVALLAAALLCGNAAAQDADAAQALAKKSDCLKCHSVDKKKEGPSFKETAAKYKGKPNAAQEVFKQVTSGPKVKVDGKDEEHPKVKSSNEADVKNLVAWILSR